MYSSEIERILITQGEIAQRVCQLGKQISEDYQGRELVLVGILKGAFVFLADLIRHISIPVAVDFVAITSYGNTTRSSGIVRIIKDLDESVEGKHVLIVEDIVDTGLTLKLSNLVENLHAKKAASVRICALLDKPHRRKVETSIEYTGFVIPNRFVVGYGLDLGGLYRNLPFIAVLKQDGCLPSNP